MIFDHYFGYSFPLFSSLLKKRREEKENELAKIVIKSHAFLLYQLKRFIVDLIFNTHPSQKKKNQVENNYYQEVNLLKTTACLSYSLYRLYIHESCKYFTLLKQNRQISAPLPHSTKLPNYFEIQLRRQNHLSLSPS